MEIVVRFVVRIQSQIFVAEFINGRDRQVTSYADSPVVSASAALEPLYVPCREAEHTAVIGDDAPVLRCRGIRVAAIDSPTEETIACRFIDNVFRPTLVCALGGIIADGECNLGITD